MKKMALAAALLSLCFSSAFATDFDLSTSGAKMIPGTVSNVYTHTSDFGGFSLAGNHRVKLTSSGAWLPLSAIVWKIPGLSNSAVRRSEYATVLASFQSGSASYIIYATPGEGTCDATQNVCTFAHFHATR